MKKTPEWKTSLGLRKLQNKFIEGYIKEYQSLFEETKENKEKWHKFFTKWVKNPKAPLLVRSSKYKGKIKKVDECDIIFCDNSPAVWAICNALIFRKPIPSCSKISKLVQTEIPIFTMLDKTKETNISKDPKYKGIQKLWRGKKSKKYREIMYKKWRVDHIYDVGIGKLKKKFEKLKRDDFKKYFLLLMSPYNIVLTPQEFGGVGDMEGYLEKIRKQIPEHIRKCFEE